MKFGEEKQSDKSPNPNKVLGERFQMLFRNPTSISFHYTDTFTQYMSGAWYYG